MFFVVVSRMNLISFTPYLIFANANANSNGFERTALGLLWLGLSSNWLLV